MARAYDESSSLRFGRRESERVVTALLLSVLVHLGIWAGYFAGDKFGLWHKLQALSQHQSQPEKLAMQAKTVPQESEPQVFVDVSHADADAPTQTKYYSDKNSRAANPDAGKLNAPKLTGKQTEIVRTETVPKLTRAAESKPPETPQDKPDDAKTENAAQSAKLQPSPLPAAPSVATAEAQETPQTPGDLSPRPKPGAQPVKRPRTLRQALAQRDHLPGEEMQQEGGVPRRAPWATLDVKSTAFGDYDRDLIMAIQQRWDDLLENHRYAENRNGKVVLQFKLKPDGTVIEMQTLDNNVGEVLGYLCQEAIEESAPFAKWPSDMTRMVGANYRELTFTFYYY